MEKMGVGMASFPEEIGTRSSFSMKQDEIFMGEALLEAQKAFDLDEVPVGAVLVFENKIIARSHNQVEKRRDASCHAEILCLREGARLLGNWRLLETTLYSTLEPCSMCAGALFLFRVKRVVYGAKDWRHGGDGTIFNVLSLPHPIHQLEVTQGIYAEKAASLLQTFFRKKRGKNE